MKALYQIESGIQVHGDYLKELGLRCPTTGSNHWENIGPALLCDADTDYIDRHCYWDHPKDGFGWQQEFDNLPALADYADSFLPAIAGTKVAGKPMVVTEWCFCWINDYVAAGPLLGASYACLHDWDAMIWFDISDALPNSAMTNEFDISNKPHLFSQWTAAALLFRRQDLKPFACTSEHTITREELLQNKPLCDEPSQRDALSQRVETTIMTSAAEAAPENKVATQDQPDQRCVWDDKAATLIVQSPNTVALTGFVGPDAGYDLGWVRVSIQSEFCSLWMTSLDAMPLPESHHVLITAVARAENSGMRFNQGRTHLVEQGHAPVLMEPVRASLVFPKEVAFRPLAQGGQPDAAVKTRSVDLGQYESMWFEVRK